MLKNKQKIIFLVLFGILLFPFFSQAESDAFRVSLDVATIVKGYTVEFPRGDFKIGIYPNVFKEESSIKLEKLDKNGLENKPQGKNLVSDLYLYDISMVRPYVLGQPIVLVLKYDSSSVYKKEVHFYNQVTNMWQAIPTQIDYQNKQARAFIHFPYSKIAVFEDINNSLGPKKITESSGVGLDAISAVLVDDKSGKILFEKNANQKLPLASLTKVMTTTIFLETNTSFDKEMVISSYDNADGAHLSVGAGDRVRAKDLFFSTLVGSKNNAAKALARSTGMSTADFIKHMNDKAKELGLSNTSFVEMTGLDSRDRSSALDYAKLSIYAYKKLAMLQASTSKSYSFRTLNSGKILSFNNTDKLVNSGLYLTGGKTGYLPYSCGGINYNLMIKAKDKNGNEIVGVIMGNNHYYDIQGEMESLIRWGFNNYRWE